MIRIKDNTIIIEHNDNSAIETIIAWKTAIIDAIQFLPDDTDRETYFYLAQILQVLEPDVIQLSKALKTK
ncbi:hypothetical protein PJIAN_4904 [Paludibacter jiangxiensis]|uniref:Uncharacterized protein n=1 Tax=Paludibacter jiangxiensis TaxID=681398 RepID=A0A161M6L4_9BACT|nr:hypothetical protein PJIAN_4904 [Paludibacter jiangxiensis]